MAQQNIKPRYEVELVDKEVTETRLKRVSGKNVEYTEKVPYGYNVFFPAGHSMRVKNKEELARLGFDQPADLIDQDSGEVVGSTQEHSLKKNVQRRAGASKRSASTSSVDANQ